MHQIDSKDLGLFEYRRYQFESRHLGRTATLGRVVPKGDGLVEGTLYYLHPGNSDDRALLELQLIERLDRATCELLLAKRIQFALPNFGLNFLLSSAEDPKRPFHEYFFEEVMPLAEEGTDTEPSTRFLAGASLGGHTSLTAFLRRPEVFKGVASTMGALLNFDFRSKEEFERYARDAGVSREVAAGLEQLFHACFERYELYRAIDPMRLLDEIDANRLGDKRILVEAGTRDDFGFHVGMSDLSQLLKRKGVVHRFEAVPGMRHDPDFVQSRFAPMLRFLLT